jgi:UDP-2,3-diacylglucosamine pyrophosphatase LpxH
MTQYILKYLPFGPKLAEAIKHFLKQSNHEFKIIFPREAIEDFAESRFAEGANRIFVGHFHREFTYCNPDSRSLYILPDWYSTQKVTVFDQKSQKATSLNWRQISGR